MASSRNSIDLQTLDKHVKYIQEKLDAVRDSHSRRSLSLRKSLLSRKSSRNKLADALTVIGSSDVHYLVNPHTAKKLQDISRMMLDCKGLVSSIDIMESQKQSGGSRLRKTQRKSQNKLRHTRKH